MLHFSREASELELQAALIECGRICYERHLMTSNDGNLSVRLGQDRVMITATGVSKGRMTADDLVVLDLGGQMQEPVQERRPSSELPMHLEVYRQRPDVGAVIHAHPVFATAVTVAGLDFPNDVLPEVVLTIGEVPVTEYATPSSIEDAAAIQALIPTHSAILLRQHGALTVGRDLEAALLRLERVEHVAEVFWRAQMLGKVNRLTPEAKELLAAIRDRSGAI